MFDSQQVAAMLRGMADALAVLFLPVLRTTFVQDHVMQELKTLRSVQQSIRSTCAEEIRLSMAPWMGRADGFTETWTVRQRARVQRCRAEKRW